MDKNTRVLRKKEQRRVHRSKARQDLLMCEYIQYKYFDIYSEAVEFYNTLNTQYPVKYDLRKTPEYRTWKSEIKGETLKIRKVPKPTHMNIQPTPRQNLNLIELQPQSQNTTEPPPQNLNLVELQPQSQNTAESPPQSPSLVELQPQNPDTAESPPQSPSLVELQPQTQNTTESPPQSPSLFKLPPPPQRQTLKEHQVYNDNLQLRIPLIRHKPKTLRPTVTTETLQIVTEEILEENTMQPSILEELAPEMIEQIIDELRLESDLRDIFADMEQQVEFEQLGMDIDIVEDNALENELDQW